MERSGGAGRLGVLFYYSIRMQLPCGGKRRVYDADRIMRPTCVDSRFSDFQIADAGPRGSFKYFYADKLNCKPVRRRQAANGFSAKNHKIAKRASHTHWLAVEEPDQFGLIINTSGRVFGMGHLRLKLLLAAAASPPVCGSMSRDLSGAQKLTFLLKCYQNLRALSVKKCRKRIAANFGFCLIRFAIL